MSDPTFKLIDSAQFGSILRTLGRDGIVNNSPPVLIDLLTRLHLALTCDDRGPLVATNRLLSLGPTKNTTSAIRRVLSLQPDYRVHLLTLLLQSVNQVFDDHSLAETVEHLDHVSSELLNQLQAPATHGDTAKIFLGWDMEVWQSPDAVTLLSKIVESPSDFAALPDGPIIVVGLNWLDWETPPINPAPAPWGDTEPLQSALSSVKHPFWGAMAATLDACTGDYEWQSLILRGGLLRSRHRTLGDAEAVMEELWRNELGLYPAAPLIVPDDMRFVPGKPLPWLRIALDHLSEYGAAIESDGSWRLTDHFRTQLMKDDEHMMAFEAVRRRSYRLAGAAATITELTNEAVAQ